MRNTRLSKTILSIILFLLLAAFPAGSLQIHAYAQSNTDESKVVRVGWYESTFNQIDKFGRRSGYAYDYQQMIAAYTGWEYEYVEGSWPELLDMLKAGEIDLMSDVSYTEERSHEMLFPSYSMGAESYYLFIDADNDEILPGRHNTLNGKKIGVNRGSIQEGMFLEWEAENGVEAEVIPLDITEQESLKLLTDGELDAFLTLDAIWNVDTYIPVEKIGESDFYFAVNKDREDLLDELNYALSRIQDKNMYYNQELYERYSTGSGASAYLNHEEVEWLEAHGPIRVGYANGRLPFCDYDETTGTLVGALDEFLTLASNCNKNATIDFETAPYQTTEEAIDALLAGETDCVFPINMSAYDSEQRGLLVTSPVMQAEMYACVRMADRASAISDTDTTVAIEEYDVSKELFVRDVFPDWEVIYCKSNEDCFRAVEAGEADAALISSYRVALTEELREKYNLSALTTNASMPMCFAVRRSDTDLYSILDNTINLVPLSMIETSLAVYSSPDTSTVLTHFVKRNIAVIILIILAVVILVIFLQIRHSRKTKAELEQRLALQEKLLAQESEKLEADKMINALSRDYRSIYYVDLDQDNAICYRTAPGFPGNTKEGDRITFSERFKLYAERYVVEEDREAFLEFIRPENIRTALAKEQLISFRFLADWDGWKHYELLRMAGVTRPSDSADNTIHAVGVGFSNVDSETRKELERNAALADALDQAEAASAAKTAFLSSMSHEIRTPMNAIIGLNSIALSNPELPDETRDCLEKISASTDHLLHLINNILDMSRIESGRMLIRNEEFSFRSMLEQINTMIDGQCQEKGLSYKCGINGHVNDYYIGDDMRLMQVLLNILGNAVKYTPAPGTVSFYVETLREFDGNASLRFTIKDTGIGMDKDFLPRVFGAFEQEEETRSDKYGSTGLGMAISKRIVEMMNGDIEVESEKGKGSCFTVTVTLRISDKESSATEIRPQDIRVLVIDDDPEALKHAKLVLDEVGILSDTCTDGQEALEMLKIGEARHEAYNMILVDWKMPDPDGIEVTRKIRRQFTDNAAIIILTAYNWEEIEEEAMDAGVDSFMTKPLFASSVLSVFSKAISAKLMNEQAPKKADLNGKHILVAEDILINAEIMKKLLGARGMEVDHAENGQIAVDMFKDNPEGTYDAILMDIRMPVLDGLGATEAIRKLDRPDAKTIPIIAMTANAFDEDVQKSLQAGLNAHLSKPVEPELLFETLETMIAT